MVRAQSPAHSRCMAKAATKGSTPDMAATPPASVMLQRPGALPFSKPPPSRTRVLFYRACRAPSHSDALGCESACDLYLAALMGFARFQTALGLSARQG